MSEGGGFVGGSSLSGVQFYPSDLDQGPFMKFTTYSVKGGVGSSMSDINFGGPFEHVMLPIPSGLNSTYAQGWDQEDVSAAKAAAGRALEGGISGLQNQAGDAESALSKAWATTKAASGGALGGLKEALTSAGVGDSLKAAGLGGVGKVIGQGAAQRATGEAVFSPQYATYSGPAFRNFSFAFSMKALSRSNTTAIDDIVKFFKLNSAPKINQGGLWRLYELPRVFAITFHKKSGQQNPMLPRISKCALTDVGVTYGGDRYSEFENNAPIQVDLTLSFKEISLLSSQDINAGF